VAQLDLIFVFPVFGLLIGSFLNVVIYRLPEGISIVTPPSRCPSCANRIAWYDNIPILSWLILRGKCRNCGHPIAWRYPLVEGLNGLLWAAAALRFGDPWVALMMAMLFSSLVVLTFIDLDHMILPNVITYPGIVVAAIAPWLTDWIEWQQCLLGILIGGGVPAFIRWLYGVIRKQEGMGLGDIKLLGMLGGFLGPMGAIWALMAGSIAGSVIAIGIMAATKGEKGRMIPFGPFLALGALIVLLVDGPWSPWMPGFGS